MLECDSDFRLSLYLNQHTNILLQCTVCYTITHKSRLKIQNNHIHLVSLNTKKQTYISFSHTLRIFSQIRLYRRAFLARHIVLELRWKKPVPRITKRHRCSDCLITMSCGSISLLFNILLLKQLQLEQGRKWSPMRNRRISLTDIASSQLCSALYSLEKRAVSVCRMLVWGIDSDAWTLDTFNENRFLISVLLLRKYISAIYYL